MSADLFSGGFAWDDVAAVATPVATRPSDIRPIAAKPLSHTAATVAATPEIRAFSGDFGWNDNAVASVASVATPPALLDTVAMPQPSHATPAATPEMAVSCGIEAESPASVAAVANVASWAAAIEAIRGTAPPEGWRGPDWRRLVSDAKALVANWGDDLIAAGWSTLDVFGVNPTASARRLDRLGLVRFLKGNAVEAIDGDTALIRVSATDMHTFDRRLIASGGVPFWVWVDGLSARPPGEGGGGSRSAAYPSLPAPVNRHEDSR